MGDPKGIRKKYNTPSHPWQRGRIEEEREIVKNYAVKNKKEIWKMNSLLKSFKNEAKKLASLRTQQARKEEALLIRKLIRYGILKEGDALDAVLIISLRDVLERRLQTIVRKKGLARTMKQARQFITHRHIKVGDSVVTSPSYLVLAEEEQSLGFCTRSALGDSEHPERKSPAIKPVEKKVEVAPTAEATE